MRQADDGDGFVKTAGERHVESVAVHAAGVEGEVELQQPAGLGGDGVGRAGMQERPDQLLDIVRETGADLARRCGAHAHDPARVAARTYLCRFLVGGNADGRDPLRDGDRHQHLEAAPIAVGLHDGAYPGLVADDLLELAYVVCIGTCVHIKPGVA